MERKDFLAPSTGGDLGGFVTGSGQRVLLAHGGPGLGFGHLSTLVDELAAGFQVAYFQQRGLPPSTTTGDFTIAEAVSDAVAVLDHLGWDRAWFVGHSWGGHLAFHVAEAIPDRLHGVLAVDPLGGVGDGAAEAFGAEMFARVPADRRARAEALDEKDMDGTATPEEEAETWDLMWPCYFADPSDIMPRPDLPMSPDAHVGLWNDLKARLPDLESGLVDIRVPVGVVVGERSPMPPDQAGRATADAIPGAWVEVVDGAGHFVWWERPGSVLRALRRLTDTPD